jgi:hypothetical protein
MEWLRLGHGIYYFSAITFLIIFLYKFQMPSAIYHKQVFCTLWFRNVIVLWQASNIIFVDQLTGTGFSYTTDPSDIRNDENGVSNDLYDFLQVSFLSFYIMSLLTFWQHKKFSLIDIHTYIHIYLHDLSLWFYRHFSKSILSWWKMSFDITGESYAGN